MNAVLIYFISAVLGSGKVATTVAAQPTETVNLSINYEVLNTRPGYSYDAKLVVYVDDKQVGESTVKNQEIPNSVTVPIPTGVHDLRVVLLAKYEDVWEERTIANDYSNDFVWRKSGNFKKDLKVKLFFDIDSGVHEKKKPKKPKTK